MDLVDGVCPRPRNPRACEQCRTSKIRCLQSNQAGICQKCLTARKECVFGVRVKRRAKGERSSPKMASQYKASITAQQPYPSPSDAQYAPKPEDSDNEVEELPLQKMHDVAFQKMIGDDEMVEEGPLEDSEPENLHEITKDFMDLDEANRTIHNFQNMRSDFPFVIVPEDATAKTMSQKSPFLLLAVLVVASPHTSNLHRKLDAEFCKLLGVKVIANGEKNLDVLQGLLVYIAWYPFHLKLHKQTMYTYLQIAISLSVQLKLDQPSRPLPPVFPPNQRLSQERESRRKSGQRSFLACHYLSSGVSAAFKKPCTISRMDYMELCGTSLAENPEVPSDRILLFIVKLGYIQYESERIFSNCSSRPDAAYVQVKIDVLSRRFQDCTSFIPLECQSSTLFKLMEHSTRLSIYSSASGPFQSSNSPLYNEIRLNMLSHCLENTKQFFDYAFEIPTTEYWKFSMMSWGHIVRSLIVALQLSSSITFSQWNSVRAREVLQLGTRLDCLCWRVQNLDIRSGEQSKARTHFSVFQAAVSSFKETYDKLVRLDLEKNSSTQALDLMDLDEWIEELGMDKCPVLNGNASQFGTYGGNEISNTYGASSNIPMYHDMWATMTMSWAT